MAKLTADNYYSAEQNKVYMSASQYRSLDRCEAAALYEIEHPSPATEAMLAGSYLDAMVEGTADSFVLNHPEMFKKDWAPKANFANIIDVYDRIKEDRMFMACLEGDKQAVFTCEIEGVPFKVKLDVLHPDRIVDLKTTASFRRVWSPEQKKYVSFAEFWRYDIQLAIYQEAVRQNTGKTLPTFLAAVTREKVPDLAILAIPDSVLEFALDEVKLSVNHFQAIKLGLEEPKRCETCDYCKRTKKLTEVIDFREIGME